MEIKSIASVRLFAMNKLLLFAIGLLIAQSMAANWAVLVAGSEGWGNYRHQADVAHMYYSLIKKGFSADNIIVMIEDDVVNSRYNPRSGKLYNDESLSRNYYEGFVVDYRGSQVTPNTFSNVMLGNAPGIGSNRVITPNSNNKIFFGYSDHGFTDYICFPGDKLLYQDQLRKIYEMLINNNMASDLLFFIEACYSGSMFYKYLPNTTASHVLAMTAANPFQSSYAAGWSSELRAWTGDEFSVTWMGELDSSRTASFSVKSLYNDVKRAVSGSEVCLYGSPTIASGSLSKFIPGSNSAEKVSTAPSFTQKVDAFAAKSEMLKRMSASNDDLPVTRDALQASINADKLQHAVADTLFATVASQLGDVSLLDRTQTESVTTECLQEVENSFRASCGSFGHYGKKYLHILGNICRSKIPFSNFNAAFIAACH